MKIVILNDGVYEYATDSHSAIGGAEWQQWLLARALASSGWAVTVGVRRFLNLGESQQIDGVKFVGIGNGYPLRAWGTFL